MADLSDMPELEYCEDESHKHTLVSYEIERCTTVKGPDGKLRTERTVTGEVDAPTAEGGHRDVSEGMIEHRTTVKGPDGKLHTERIVTGEAELLSPPLAPLPAEGGHRDVIEGMIEYRTTVKGPDGKLHTERTVTGEVDVPTAEGGHRDVSEGMIEHRTTVKGPDGKLRSDRRIVFEAITVTGASSGEGHCVEARMVSIMQNADVVFSTSTKGLDGRLHMERKIATKSKNPSVDDAEAEWQNDIVSRRYACYPKGSDKKYVLSSGKEVRLVIDYARPPADDGEKRANVDVWRLMSEADRAKWARDPGSYHFWEECEWFCCAAKDIESEVEKRDAMRHY